MKKPKKTTKVVVPGAVATDVLQTVLDRAAAVPRPPTVGIVVLVFHLDGRPGLLCSGQPRMSQEAIANVLVSVADQMVPLLPAVLTPPKPGEVH